MAIRDDGGPGGAAPAHHAVEVDATSLQLAKRDLAEVVVADGTDQPTAAPARRAARAWLAPLPPGMS